MLTITIPPIEMFDEETNRFYHTKKFTVRLEHSLISIFKWEGIYERPFLTPDGQEDDKTLEEGIAYLRCMIIGDVPDWVVDVLWHRYMGTISEYIKKPCTATKVYHHAKPVQYGKRRPVIVTAELVYYWMVELHVPLEFEKWHFNRLMRIIEVFRVKSSKDNKMDPAMSAQQRQTMNAARLAASKAK